MWSDGDPEPGANALRDRFRGEPADFASLL
jgi:hypothetical protein